MLKLRFLILCWIQVSTQESEYPCLIPDHRRNVSSFSHWVLSCAVFLVTQLSPTLCSPKDCSPPGSSVHGILQTRILKWITISSFCVFIIYDLIISRYTDSFYNLFPERFYPKCVMNLANAFYDSEIIMWFLLLILLMWGLMLIDL